MTRIKIFRLAEVLKYVGTGKHKFFANDKLYLVRMNTERMQLIARTQICACCFAKGSHFWLEHSGHYPPHFNLYAKNHYGHHVLLTMDHILPKSKGGKTEPNNLQLLCANCNERKKNRLVSLEELREERCQKDPMLRKFIEKVVASNANHLA